MKIESANDDIKGRNATLMYSMETLTLWVMKWRFTILCLLVFGIMCLHTIIGQWVGDFWEHSAVVRELATHMLHPKHPQLLLDTPHAFYSPYAVMVALLARMLHLDVISVLSIMGLLNLGLFFLGLRLFVFSIVPKRRRETAFYALLLTLFCWGSHPWGWSGFFHIGVLGYVLPYPSTFAAALALITLGVNRLRIATMRQIWVIPIFLMAVTVLISHPITFLFLAVGLVSQSCIATGAVTYQIMLVWGLLSLALLAAVFWPYFPVLKLLMGGSSVYDFSNRIMYEHVLSRIWPSLIGVPLIIASMKSNWRRPLVWMLAFLSGIYAFGTISGKYSYGRVISFIVLLLHIGIAEHLSMLESVIQKIRGSSWLQRLILPASVIVIAVLLSSIPLTITLARTLHEQPPPYKSYLFLSQFIRQYDVVLSDTDTSWMVPTFGGKIVAAKHPLAFVPDQDVRKADIDRFFDRETAKGERQKIMDKYRVKFLLLRRVGGPGWQELQQSFMSYGKLAYESDTFVLIMLSPDPGKDVARQ